MKNQIPSTLQTGVSICKNVNSFIFGQNKICEIENILKERRSLRALVISSFL